RPASAPAEECAGADPLPSDLDRAAWVGAGVAARIAARVAAASAVEAAAGMAGGIGVHAVVRAALLSRPGIAGVVSRRVGGRCGGHRGAEAEQENETSYGHVGLSFRGELAVLLTRDPSRTCAGCAKFPRAGEPTSLKDATGTFGRCACPGRLDRGHPSSAAGDSGDGAASAAWRCWSSSSCSRR